MTQRIIGYHKGVAGDRQVITVTQRIIGYHKGVAGDRQVITVTQRIIGYHKGVAGDRQVYNHPLISLPCHRVVAQLITYAKQNISAKEMHDPMPTPKYATVAHSGVSKISQGGQV